MIKLLAILLIIMPLSLEAEIIHKRVGQSVMSVTACNDRAGGVCSLKWHGKEWIDDYDLGRQFQMSVTYKSDNPEAINPTEVGNRKFNRSKLLYSQVLGETLHTATQAMYYLTPSECSPNGNCPSNRRKLSNTIMQKWVKIGYKGFTHVVEYKSRFILEDASIYGGGYDPVMMVVSSRSGASFDEFYTFENGKLVPLEINQQNINFERKVPIVVSDGYWAWALYDPTATSYSIKYSPRAGSSIKGETGVTGLFAVHRVESKPYAVHEFDTYYIIGSIHTITTTLGRVMDSKGRQ